MEKNRIVAYGLAGAIFVTGGFVLAKKMFFKEMECEYKDKIEHTHVYQNSSGLRKLIQSHYYNRSGFFKYTDEIGQISKEILDADKYGYFSVELNRDYVENVIRKNFDYSEYEITYEHYEQTGTKQIPMTMTSVDSNGNVSISTYYMYDSIYGWVRRSDWLTDQDYTGGSNVRNVVYTGMQRDVTHVYTMYSFNDDTNGEPFYADTQVSAEDVFKYKYFKGSIVRSVYSSPYPIYENTLKRSY